MAGRRKKNYSTKLDNVPHDDELRKQMIEQFIEDSQKAKADGTFEVIEAVPYEAGQMVRSTAGSKRKSD
jgi:pseudouridine-5'-phosphate glycosidase